MGPVGELISKGEDDAAIYGLHAKVAKCVFNDFQVLPIFGLSIVRNFFIPRTLHVEGD
jgi:hypothetical protein